MRALTLFDAVSGEAGVLRLAHAWLERVLVDDIVAHAFSHGFHPKHTAYPGSQRDVPGDLRIPRWSWDGLQAWSRATRREPVSRRLSRGAISVPISPSGAQSRRRTA
jgi:hypothetical protein